MAKLSALQRFIITFAVFPCTLTACTIGLFIFARTQGCGNQLKEKILKPMSEAIDVIGNQFGEQLLSREIAKFQATVLMGWMGMGNCQNPCLLILSHYATLEILARENNSDLNVKFLNIFNNNIDLQK